MANTENPEQTGTVEDNPSTTTSTTTDKTSYAEPVAPAGVDEDEYKHAHEQFEKDQEQLRENPNEAVVREADPSIGGEGF